MSNNPTGPNGAAFTFDEPLFLDVHGGVMRLEWVAVPATKGQKVLSISIYPNPGLNNVELRDDKTLRLFQRYTSPTG